MLHTLLTFITLASVVAAGGDDDNKIFIKSKKAEKHGKSFVVVGGFGNMKDLNRTNHVFDAINLMKKNAKKNSPQDFDFFVTTGDNLKPADRVKPTEDEMNKMMDLFKKRDAIKDIDIYPVRGNHGARFADQEAWVKFSEKHENWKMPGLYYSSSFHISNEGHKMSMLHLDSNYLLCYFFNKYNTTTPDFKLMDHRTKKIFTDHCNKTAGDDVKELKGVNNYTKEGGKMFDWALETMEDHAKDSKIIFKAVILHHPMFGLYYDDYMVLVNRFLPKLRKYGYDLYINGLEHQLNYATFPLDDIGTGRTGKKFDDDIDKNNTCFKRSEFFPEEGPEQKTRTFMSSQGEFVNQVTVGASGKTTFPICAWNMQKSHGKFIYGESYLNGFALVHATKHAIDVKLYGVNYMNKTEVAKEKEAELMMLSHHHHDLDEDNEHDVEEALDEDLDAAIDEVAAEEFDGELPEIEEEDEINDSDFDFSEDTKAPKKAGTSDKDVEDDNEPKVKASDKKALADKLSKDSNFLETVSKFFGFDSSASDLKKKIDEKKKKDGQKEEKAEPAKKKEDEQKKDGDDKKKDEKKPEQKDDKKKAAEDAKDKKEEEKKPKDDEGKTVEPEKVSEDYIKGRWPTEDGGQIELEQMFRLQVVRNQRESIFAMRPNMFSFVNF